MCTFSPTFFPIPATLIRALIPETCHLFHNFYPEKDCVPRNIPNGRAYIKLCQRHRNKFLVCWFIFQVQFHFYFGKKREFNVFCFFLCTHRKFTSIRVNPPLELFIAHILQFLLHFLCLKRYGYFISKFPTLKPAKKFY